MIKIPLTVTNYNRDFRKIIQTIYEVHNPSKIEEIPMMLLKYKGREMALIEAICEKYSIEPDQKVRILQGVEKEIASNYDRKLRRKLISISIGALCAIASLTTYLLLAKDSDNSENSSMEQSGAQVHFQETPTQALIGQESRNVVQSNYIVQAEKSYFHDRPDETAIRNAYLVKSERVKSLKEEDDFIYVEFKNATGKISKGWISKSDLSEDLKSE